MNYKPYTYLIGWSKENKFYYGSQYSKIKNKANPENLWNTYFTSSNYVKLFREAYGEPDIISIRKTFNTAKEAILWEYKVLQRLNVRKNKRWLNINDGKAPYSNKSFSQERRNNISKRTKGENNPNYGKNTPEEVRKKISNSLKGKTAGEKNGMYGKKHTKQTRKLMCENHADYSGSNNPNYGNKWSLEEKRKQSEKRNPKIYTFIHDIHGIHKCSLRELTYRFPEIKRSSLKGLASKRLKTLKGWTILFE